jgi:hypothetical protein
MSSQGTICSGTLSAPEHACALRRWMRQASAPRLQAAATMLVGIVLAACSGPAYIDRSEGDPGLFTRALGPVVFEVGAELERTPPGCIAVLPFETVADTDENPGHAEHVRRAIYARLAPRAERDIELARVDEVIRALSVGERRNPALVGRALGCNTLVIGTVTEYRQRYLGLYSDVAVGAQVELIRRRTASVSGRAVMLRSAGAAGCPPLCLAWSKAP